MGGRPVVWVLDQSVDDVVAGQPAIEQHEQPDADKAPARSAQRLPPAAPREPHGEREQGEGKQRQDQRRTLDGGGDVLHGLELAGAHDHELTDLTVAA